MRSKSLLEIAAELQRLQADASVGKLGIADLKGGTFSLSNIGNLGGTYTGRFVFGSEHTAAVCVSLRKRALALSSLVRIGCTGLAWTGLGWFGLGWWTGLD